MATKKTSTRIAKSSALVKVTTDSVERLTAAMSDSAKAMQAKNAESKKLLTQNKRLIKKCGALVKKKAIAKRRLKANPNVANRKALSSVGKELDVTTKALAKSRSLKSTVNEELNDLKTAHKRITAYVKALEKTEKALNKPAKKKRRKKIAASA